MLYLGRDPKAAAAVISAVVLGLLSFLQPAQASGNPVGSITTFPLGRGSAPLGMNIGPDGNLWFTELANGSVSRIGLDGRVTPYPVAKGRIPAVVAAGADGNLWFTEFAGGRVVKMTTGGKVLGGWSITAGYSPSAITPGPDGNLWFTAAAAAHPQPAEIGRITPHGTIAYFPLVNGAKPMEITTGPDGNLWFTEAGARRIVKMNISGTVLGSYPIADASAGDLAGISPGPDGNLWFTENLSDRVGKITTAGLVTTYALPRGSGPGRVVAGADGNLWVANLAGNSISRLSIGGIVLGNYRLKAPAAPGGTTSGPDGNMWFTEKTGGAIGRVTSGAPPPRISAVHATSARIAGQIHPGGATATSSVECARRADFAGPVIRNDRVDGSPATSVRAVTVAGLCSGLRPGTRYYARIRTLLSVRAFPRAYPIGRMYTTISTFVTTRKSQVPRDDCVLVPPILGPDAIRPNSLTRLTKPGCTTNAGQQVRVRATSTLRGDLRLPRVFYRDGSWWLQTFATPARTRIWWFAPAFGGYSGYELSVVRDT